MNPLLPHTAYLDQVLGLVKASASVEQPLARTRGLALAHDVRAPIDTPPFTNSSLDGFAVLASDIRQVPVTLPIVAEIPAGTPSVVTLEQGTAHRIMTGAPLPKSADAVVPIEWTVPVEGGVQVNRAPEAGHGVRFSGSDVSKGAVITRSGQEVTTGVIGLASSLGIDSLPVVPRPRVTVISTGDELQVPGSPLAFGKIYDANLELMVALIDSCGAVVANAHRLTDDVENAVTVLRQAASDSDLIVTSGGISAGDFEVIKQAGTALGGFEFRQIALQPGKPQGFGLIGATPVIALPGNPVSTYVSYLMFVYPALRKLGGHRELRLPRARGRATSSIRPSPDRVRLLPGSLNFETSEIQTPASHSSHLVSTIAATNALIVVPSGNQPIPAGAELEVFLTPLP